MKYFHTPMSTPMSTPMRKPMKNLSKFSYQYAAVAMALVMAIAPTMAQTQTSTTRYEYDATGNVNKITDPNNLPTLQTFDELGRLKTRTDADGKITQYNYNGQDYLTQLTDARNVITLYTVDGLGNQLLLTSPDSGTTRQTFDEAGNVLTRTDAKAQVTRYTWDVLNRVQRILYHDGKAINFTYDEGVNAKGRLSQISDDNGSIRYQYDGRGRVLSEERTIKVNSTPATTATSVTRYQYDMVGRLTRLTYPNGRRISYTRDSLGRITQIASDKNGVVTPILSQVSYRPFGGLESYRNSADQAYTRSFDLDGRITGYTLNNQVQAITYDAGSRIISINQLNNPARQASYGYDNIDRLTSFQTTQSNQSFGYDAVGNRTSQTLGATGTAYTYGTNSNRLTQINNTPIVTDANGSISSNGNAQFDYDARGRMISAQTAQGQVHYQINALGQRVQKSVPGVGGKPNLVTLYHYDLAGKLIAETTGDLDTNYVYLDEIPVAVIK